MTGPTTKPALRALRQVDFDWTTHQSGVWKDPTWDVSDLHAELRGEFEEELGDMVARPRTESPLGWVIGGKAGSGKTHLLGAFRRAAAKLRAAFILVDMTDVRDFWATVLQGYVDSLSQKLPIGLFQQEWVIQNVLQRAGAKAPLEILRVLQHDEAKLLDGVERILTVLHRMSPRETSAHADVVRALVCLSSSSREISGLGLTFLQGQAIDDEPRRKLGFGASQRTPREVVKALSWLLNFSGPTVLAFDQLDAIVQQSVAIERRLGEADAEANAAFAIIQEIAAGFSAVRDLTVNTLSVVACLDDSWDALSREVSSSFLDRFQPIRRLTLLQRATLAETVVRSRLSAGYSAVDFAPPYPTWPFHPEAFQTLGHDTPREVLQKCHALRQGWLRSGEIVEVSRFGEPAPPTDRPDTRFKSLDDAFALYKREAKPAALLDPEEEEAGLASLLQTALTSLVHELAPPPGGEAVVDVEFTGGVKRKPLHARLRIVAADQSERHFCVRAIQQMHPLAFQPRLREAVTAAGISSSLSFRHLAIVRSTPKLTGRATLNQVAEFEQAGGRFAVPTEEEIRTLSAIKKMRAEQLDGLTEWLRDRRPLSQLPLLRTIVDTVLDEFAPTKKPAAVAPIEKGPDKPTTGRGDSPSKPGPTGVSTGGGRTSDGTDDPSHNGVNGKGPVDPSGTKPSGAGVKTSPLDAPPLDPAESSGRFPLGWNLRGEKLIDPLEMDLTLLAKHTAILAGAGSGKTVLLKRLIESAALRGVPSIVFDCAQDLVQLKQDWTTPHAAWLPGDAAAARRLREQTEVVVWTPNLSKGNPLSLETLPDLAAVADDEDELQSGIVMASESLQEIVAQGQSVASQNKQGILRKTLKYFAQTGGGTLADYMDLLRSLPSDARLNVQNEQKLAKQMADALTVAIEKDPLLQATGPVLDPASLFGLESQSGKVRISVVSLIGLPTKGAQQTFLNQLAMRLFTWIKKNPAPKGKLRGLFVIDEAKDFAPSIRSTPCKASLQRLAAQARKYGLGVVIATQMPREVDASLIGNCSTHYYGKANSSAALEAIKDQIRERGGSGDDVARLTQGRFYVFNSDADFKLPVKVGVPMCLAYHDRPLTDAEIVPLAAESRTRLAPAT